MWAIIGRWGTYFSSSGLSVALEAISQAKGPNEVVGIFGGNQRLLQALSGRGAFVWAVVFDLMLAVPRWPSAL